MKFIDYMNGLPNKKAEEIKTIAELTCSSIQAVYNWIRGNSVPSTRKRSIISERLGFSETELWPELLENKKGGAE